MPERRTPDPSLDTVAAYLAVGDVDSARRDAEIVENGLSRSLRRRADPVLAMRRASILGELHFTLGQDTAAQELLEPFAASDALLASSLGLRQKLQLAEYYYSLFDTPNAERVAEGVRIAAKADEDWIAVAESHFYTARFLLRQDRYVEANQHCMEGIESVHRAVTTSDRMRRQVRWQTGRLLRVRGTALWQQGRLTEAKAVLYLAAWILKEGRVGGINVGDALHALGQLLRADGPSRHADAIAALEEARDHYRHHDLKLARTLVALARSRHNMGLALTKQAKPAEAANLFRQSRTELDNAMDIVQQHVTASAAVRPSMIWRRQHVELLIWQSWIRQESDVAADREAAAADGLAAVTQGDDIPARASDRIEARLALGNCLLLRARDVPTRHAEFIQQARSHLQDAKRLADELRENLKLRFHAELCLALLECRAGRLNEAQGHLEAAERLKGERLQASSFLLERAEDVRREIGQLAPALSCFMLDRSDVLAKPPAGQKRLDVLSARVAKWALDTVKSNDGGTAKLNDQQAAEFLGISKRTVENIRKRAKSMKP